MKRLNEKEWEIMRDALSIKQMEQVQRDGAMTLNKKQMIERLMEDVEEINKNILMEVKVENVEEQYKDMVTTIRANSIKHIEEDLRLFTKLVNDNEEYSFSVMKGTRG